MNINKIKMFHLIHLLLLFLSIFLIQCSGTTDTTKQLSADSTTSSTISNSTLTLSMSLGANHAMLLKNGKVKIFGHNAYGQLGIGSTTNMGDNAGEMASLNYIFELGDNITKISAGGSFSIVLFDSGKIKSWGLNNNGQLGYDNTTTYGDNQGEIFSLNYISFNEKITDIASGQYHTIALFSNGKIKCWGHNAYGQLGYGHTNNLGDNTGEIALLDFVPINVTVTQISAGDYHTVVLSNEKKVYSWGYNSQNQLGYGNTANVGDSAGEIASLNYVYLTDDVIQIATGSSHTVVLTSSGKVISWGNNTYGQLGYGDTITIGRSGGDTPFNLGYVKMDYTVKVKKIAAGMNHTVALFENGKIRCWGYNAYGQLGYNHTTNIGHQLYNGNIYPDPTNDYVNLGGTAVDIFAGGDSTCAVMSDGKVYCWGRNDNGQLGLNSGNAAPYNMIGNDEYPLYGGEVTY